MPGADLHRTFSATLVAPAAAVVAVAVALFAMGHRLATEYHGSVVMVPATAAGILLAAIALLLLRPARGATAREVGRAFAMASAALGVAIFAYHIVFGSGFPNMSQPGDAGLWAQPPGPVTGLGLAFLGAALLGIGSLRVRNRAWGNLAAAATMAIALTELVGHAYGASLLYGLHPWGGTALSTATALSVLAVGALSTDFSRGIAAVSASRSAGGHLMRRLVPAALLAPLALGWLSLVLERSGFVDVAFGTALLVMSVVVLLVGMVVRQAIVLHRVDAELRNSEQRYRLLADMIPQHIWTTDADGYHNYFSRRWYEYTGTTQERAQGEGWLDLLHPEDRERTMARWNESLRTGRPYAIEYRFRDRTGNYGWFLGQAMAQRDESGRIVQWFGTLTDISERKRLDEARERILESEREAREQVTTILESITDAFFALDRQWRFTYMNREAERLLQRPRAELLGRVVWDEFPEARDSTFEREYRRAAAENRTIKFEEHYAPLGIWADVRAYPSTEGLSVFFRDISRRKRAEAELRESERNFRAMANSIPQLAWMADAAGWIFWYNERWHEYTGATLEEMQGWGWRKVHHPEHVDRVVERIKRSFESGEPWEDIFPLRSRTGEYRWFLSRALPIKDRAGNVSRWFGTNTDITEAREAAAERERLLQREREARADAEGRREELERVTESRAKLMRGFSHDVRNPLGAADAQAWLLEDGTLLGELSEKQKQAVQRIRRSIRGSLRLIEDLLEITRTEAGRIDLQRSDVDVGEIAREVVEDFEAPAVAAGHLLEVRVPAGLEAETDPTRVRQILANLLSNAVKYASKGPITVDALRAQSGGPRPGAWIALSVIDTGPGIPEDKRETIFEEYSRLEPGAQPGAGIGLAISRRIARLLGGDLTVTSEVGRGSTFTLWLPPSR